MTYRLWGLLLPGHCEKLSLPALLPALTLLPYWVNIVVQQYPERAHIRANHTVVKGKAEAAILGPVTKKQFQPGHILLLPYKPTQSHVVLTT